MTQTTAMVRHMVEGLDRLTTCAVPEGYEQGRNDGLDEAAAIFDKRAEANIPGSAWYTDEGKTIYNKVPRQDAKPANGPAIAYLANCDHAYLIRSLKHATPTLSDGEGPEQSPLAATRPVSPSANGRSQPSPEGEGR